MADSAQNILDDDRIGQLLMKMAVPVFLSTSVTMLYNIISTVFVGRYVGSLAIGGIAFVSPIQILCMAFAQLFGVGAASVISRAIGADNRERAERALGNAILGIVIVSALIMLLGYVNIDFWLKLIGISADILPYARDYLSIILFGIIFQDLALTLSSMITAEGNARVSMIGMIIGAFSNIIFDVIFVVILKLGVKGAAIGTVFAQILSTAYFLGYYFRGKSFLKIHFHNLAIRWKIVWAMASIGISIFFMEITWSVSAIFLNSALIIYGGGLAVSAYGIVSRLIGFSALPGMSVGQGMQPILGFNFGKKRYDRALRVIKLAMITTTIFSTSIFILFQAVPVQIAGIFTKDRELITLTAYAIRHVFITNFVTGIIISGIFIFQSLGKAKQTFLITLRTLIFLLPLVLILPRFFKLDGVFLAYPLTEVGGFILASVLLVPQIKELVYSSRQNTLIYQEGTSSLDTGNV